MSKLIIRLPSTMALATAIILTSNGPVYAQRTLRAAALPPFDRVYQQSLRTMQTAARAVGLNIDTDIDVLLSTTSSHMLLATLDGFEKIVLEENEPNEFDWGFANVAGIEGLPDDYYRLHIVVDLRSPEEALGSFINSRGEVFTFPLQLMDDPHPDRGARKSLTSGGGPIGYAIYIRTKSGSFRCLAVELG